MASVLGCLKLRTILTQLNNHCSYLSTITFAPVNATPISLSWCSVLSHLNKYKVPLYSSQIKIKRLLTNVARPIQEVNFEKLTEMLNNKSVILVDVREPGELQSDGKIPGSINIPSGKIEEAFQMSSEKFQTYYGIPLPQKDAPNLVLSCKSGRRASTAIQKISALGFKAKCYCGSFQDWVEKGGKIEKA